MDIINIIEQEIKAERHRVLNQWKEGYDALSQAEKNTGDILSSALNIIEAVKKALLERGGDISA